MPQAIAVEDLGFAWPDGQVVFDGSASRSARAAAGSSGPTARASRPCCACSPASWPRPRGTVQVTRQPRLSTPGPDLGRGPRVEEVLGIARARRALRAIERGEVAEERAQAVLERLGLGHLGLDRRVGEVSGGEAVLFGAGRPVPAATRCAAGRADQQPGPVQPPPAGPGPRRLPGRAPGGQPRPAVPPDHRGSPDGCAWTTAHPDRSAVTSRAPGRATAAPTPLRSAPQCRPAGGGVGGTTAIQAMYHAHSVGAALLTRRTQENFPTLAVGASPDLPPG
jgi:hypothetical protein